MAPYARFSRSPSGGRGNLTVRRMRSELKGIVNASNKGAGSNSRTKKGAEALYSESESVIGPTRSGLRRLRSNGTGGAAGPSWSDFTGIRSGDFGSCQPGIQGERNLASVPPRDDCNRHSCNLLPNCGQRYRIQGYRRRLQMQYLRQRRRQQE